MFNLKSASIALVLAAASAYALDVDCTQCDNGLCYVVVSTENGSAAPSTCSAAGGVLARLTDASGSFAFVSKSVLPKQLPNFNTSKAFIESWNGDDYGETCITLTADSEGDGAAVNGVEQTCSETFPAVCQFTLEGSFAQCANCTDQCFEKTGKCFRIKQQDFTESAARAACEADGGKLWNANGAEEFYFVNELTTGKISVAFADGYNGDSYEDACIGFYHGSNPDQGEGGAMTAVACSGPLPAICEYAMSNKTERCPSEVQDIDDEELTYISNLAAKYPSVKVSVSSGVPLVSGVVGFVFSMVACVMSL